MSSSCRIEVRGMNPITAAGEAAEQRWKQLIVETVVQLQTFEPRAVRIVFFVLPSNRTGYDLDNLTKPVLDALFKVKCNSPFTGGMFQCDDSVVSELHVVRHHVNSLEQAGIDFEAWS